jgi:hypothetical protein
MGGHLFELRLAGPLTVAISPFPTLSGVAARGTASAASARTTGLELEKLVVFTAGWEASVSDALLPSAEVEGFEAGVDWPVAVC